MKNFSLAHWAGSSAPTVSIQSITLPYFNGSLSGVGAATYSAYNNLYFIAVNSGAPYAMSSPDGTTWTQRSLPASSTVWDSVASDNSRFMVGSSASTTGCASALGNIASWSTVTFPNFGPYKRSLTGGAGAYKFSNGRQYISLTNGSSWTTYLFSTQAIYPAWQRGVAQVTSRSDTNVLYWAGSSGVSSSPSIGAVTTSPVANSSLWMVYRNASSNLAYSSANGTTWITRTAPTVQARTLAGTSGQWMVAFASNSPDFVYTKDGVTWYTGTLPTSDAWNACASSSNDLMLFSQSSTQAYKITIS